MALENRVVSDLERAENLPESPEPKADLVNRDQVHALLSDEFSSYFIDELAENFDKIEATYEKAFIEEDYETIGKLVVSITEPGLFVAAQRKAQRQAEFNNLYEPIQNELNEKWKLRVVGA